MIHSVKPQVTGPGSIRHPIILPSITSDLQKKLNDIGLLKAQKNFIAFWAAHLSYVTNQWPTKSDYQNFAQSIVAAYPALADIGGGCTLVKSQLSVWIRNHRALEKRQSQKRKKDEEGEIPFVIVQASIAKNVDRATDYVTNTDIQNALKELEKKCVGNKNISHMKHLLKITISHRRPWIDEAKRIVDIVHKYPQLNNYELVCFV
ncbi:uncharacterized protein [Linepithema humile]|uniref:uncharacterized protein n=1 Tax=Linepithema humile TaxID=83485 RepID=UPI00351F4B24